MTSEHQSITGQTPGTTPRLRVDVLTTFTEMFASGRGDAGTGTDPGVVATGALNVSIPARARAAGLVEWHAHDLRAFTHSKHRKTDDRPFGGGPGMVMMCQPVYDAVRAVEALDPRPARRVLMSPQGKRLTQELVEELARESRVLIIAGHYEGLDERVLEELSPLEVSLGDYVLSGGELAAMVLMDAIIRKLPGALGHEDSAEQDSFGVAADGKRLLDCPHYTKPREWMGMGVPEILLSGDHAKIAKWRHEQALARTTLRRPDLLS